MEKYVLEMIDTINLHIAMAYEYFQIHHKNDELGLAKIRGMIDMLRILTDRNYIITASGLKEV